MFQIFGNLDIKTPSSASLVLIFQLWVLRPRPTVGVMALWPMMAGAERSKVALGSSDMVCLLYRFVLMPLLEKISLARSGV